MMELRRFLGLALTVASIVLACSRESAIPTSSEGELLPAAGGGKNRPYTITFEGDIQGSVIGVPLSTSDPLKQVRTGGVTFKFPELATGTSEIGTNCEQKQQELGETTNDWRGYALSPWSGDLVLSRGGGGGYHLQLTGNQQDSDGGYINLVVNAKPAVSTKDEAGNAFLSFDDARALISAFSYAVTDDGTENGNPIYDPQDRCVDFTITAAPQ